MNTEYRLKDRGSFQQRDIVSGSSSFYETQPWMTKYNQVKGTMTMIGEISSFEIQLHVRLQDKKVMKQN